MLTTWMLPVALESITLRDINNLWFLFLGTGEKTKSAKRDILAGTAGDRENLLIPVLRIVILKTEKIAHISTKDRLGRCQADFRAERE